MEAAVGALIPLPRVVFDRLRAPRLRHPLVRRAGSDHVRPQIPIELVPKGVWRAERRPRVLIIRIPHRPAEGGKVVSLVEVFQVHAVLRCEDHSPIPGILGLFCVRDGGFIDDAAAPSALRHGNVRGAAVAVYVWLQAGGLRTRSAKWTG